MNVSINMKLLGVSALICCWSYVVGCGEAARKVEMICFILLVEKSQRLRDLPGTVGLRGHGDHVLEKKNL